MTQFSSPRRKSGPPRLASNRRALAAALVAAGAVAACSHDDEAAPAKPPTPAMAAPATATPSAAPAPRAEPSAEARDAAAAAEVADAGYQGPRIGAMAMVTLVMSDMEWPHDDARRSDKSKGSVRIGYLRHGARAPVIPEKHVKANCTEGWYELVGGGFVCGRYATLDLNHPRVRLAPHDPDLEAPL
ncbi:MAG TPA: hypothetical protein PK141_12080, partial [Polyangiaceae bacterium]|nr:hypothetical protein [Polyangiaceae bacterium]